VPSRWEVTLAGAVGVSIPLTAPHAVISGWLDDARPRRNGAPVRPGQSGHNEQARKWACGPPQARPGVLSGQSGEAIVLQVRLLDDSLADRLADAIRPGLAVRLGAHQYHVSQAAQLIGRASWYELRRSSGTRAWQVQFITPTCFRRGSRTSPWPAPDSVARGLAERWCRLHPETAPAPPLPGSGSVWVSDLEGRSEACILTRNVRKDGRWHLEDEVISGFTGRVRYVCDHGREDAEWFGALLAFAAFAGVGSHTTYGFGVIASEPTWEPPTAAPTSR
jgi:CRISPR-associated endoribonuclease Cas6